MKSIIAKAVSSFETGKLSRRELVEGLAVLFAAGGGASLAAGAAKAQAPGGGAPLAFGEAEAVDSLLTPTGVDHVSMTVQNLEVSKKFYREVFGLVPINEDVENRISRLGVAGTPGALVSIREEPITGLIDHIALRIDGWNRERDEPKLIDYGLTPENNLDFGYFVRDPDGAPVQIV